MTECHDNLCDNEAVTECMVTGKPLCGEHARRGVDIMLGVGPRECLDCGHRWRYAGSADRPTCPKCKGKRTQPVE